MQNVLTLRRKQRARKVRFELPDDNKSEFQFEEREIERVIHPTQTDEYGFPVNLKRVLKSRYVVIRAENKAAAKKLVRGCTTWTNWVDRNPPHDASFKSRVRMFETKMTVV